MADEYCPQTDAAFQQSKRPEVEAARVCVRSSDLDELSEINRARVELAEQFADGLVGSEILEEARWVCLGDRDAFRAACLAAEWIVGGDCLDVDMRRPQDKDERSQQMRLLRDLVGPLPFRPVAVDPAWLTSDVVALATGIYQERAFERMPYLADALEDAGCDNEDVLNHCRQPGEHVRGCWVVDLLTGRK